MFFVRETNDLLGPVRSVSDEGPHQTTLPLPPFSELLYVSSLLSLQQGKEAVW